MSDATEAEPNPVESEPPAETTTESTPEEGEQPAAAEEGEQPAAGDEGEEPGTESKPEGSEQPAAGDEGEEPGTEISEGEAIEEGELTKAEEEGEEKEGEEAELPEEAPVEEKTIKQEHLDYMALAKDIVDQNRVCEELKQLIGERKTRAFPTRCEDREMSSLQKNYEEENDKLMILLQEAIGLQFDNKCQGDDHGQRKETTINEDLAAARMLRDLCASCKQGPCNLDKKRGEAEKCKKCGASTGRSESQHLEKVIKRMEKTLDSLRKNLYDLQRR